MSISSYLKNEGLTYESFGQMIGVTGTTVYRYTTGDRFPRRTILSKIEKVTNGKLTSVDFPLPTKKINKQRSE